MILRNRRALVKLFRNLKIKSMRKCVCNQAVNLGVVFASVGIYLLVLIAV